MLNWLDIDTVLLDMDGTLLDLHFDNYFWLEHLPLRYAEYREISVSGARIILQEMSTALKGSLNWYCVDYWSDVLDIDLTIMKTEVSHLISYRPHAVDFLKYLNSLNKEVILVTNAHPKVLKIKADITGLDQHFKKIVSAHNLLIAKENKGFWGKFQEKETINLHRSLFIDDNLAVLKCAQQEGVAHVLQILQPDSKQAVRPTSEFPGIIHFSEIMAPHEENQ